jgi:hypothetical protein
VWGPIGVDRDHVGERPAGDELTNGVGDRHGPAV